MWYDDNFNEDGEFNRCIALSLITQSLPSIIQLHNAFSLTVVYIIYTLSGRCYIPLILNYKIIRGTNHSDEL